MIEHEYARRLVEQSCGYLAAASLLLRHSLRDGVARSVELWGISLRLEQLLAEEKLEEPVLRGLLREVLRSPVNHTGARSYDKGQTVRRYEARRLDVDLVARIREALR